MERQWIALLVAWVLLWLTAIAIVVPIAALGATADRRGLAGEWGAAVIWTWLTVSIAVPLTAAIGALNWATALLITVAWPLCLWYYRHQGHTRAALVLLVRRVVLHTMSSDRVPTTTAAAQLEIVASVLPLFVVPMLWSRLDMRVPAPADFDTLSNMQALLGNAVKWDPIAAFGALLTPVSTVAPLLVVNALRLSLIAVAALAVATILAVELGVARLVAIVAALSMMYFAPAMPASAWAVLVAALLGVMTLIRWMRTNRPRDGWHTVAAAAVLVGQIIPLTSGPLPILSRTSRFVELPAAPLQALAIARANPGDDWLIVAPPQQRLELSRPDRHYDLATFVDRFVARAGERQFRFAMPAQRIYLFIELQPGASSGLAQDSVSLAAEAAVYRVPRERQRLQTLARQLCDDYRRTHAGVRIAYDDGELRVCEIAV